MKRCAAVLLLALGVGAAHTALAGDAEFEEVYGQLLALCQANPTFKASSIDFYREADATVAERQFYEAAALLHAAGNRASEFLLAKRNVAMPASAQCIDSILNTWPG